MDRRHISTHRAPAALGPYSQAVVAGGFVFCSGTVGVDPATGRTLVGIERQTEQALTNLGFILEEAGSSLQHLVKTTIMYTHVLDFAIINEIRALHARPATCPFCTGQCGAAARHPDLHRRDRRSATP